MLYPILKRNRFDGCVTVVPVPTEDETRWLLMQAAEHDFIRAVVGWAELNDPHVGHVLDEYQRHPKFRGVRWWFDGSCLPEGLHEIARRGLTLDVAATLPGELLEAHPGLRVVGDDARQVPVEFARHANLYVKIAALITPCPGKWKAADFQPAVRAALAAFGAQRVMYGSDWPAYLPEGTWKEALAAFTQAIGPQSMETREHLLGATGGTFYSL